MAMVLRARWTGPLPVANEYLMSQGRRTKHAYRIVEVEHLRDHALVPGYARLKISVDKIAAIDVPPGAVVHPWKWDARKKTGFAWSGL